MFSFATELSLPEYLCARATGMTGRAHSRVHGTMCRTCKNKNHRKCCTSCHGLCCAHGPVVLISVPGPRSTNTPQKTEMHRHDIPTGIMSQGERDCWIPPLLANSSHRDCFNPGREKKGRRECLSRQKNLQKGAGLSNPGEVV